MSAGTLPQYINAPKWADREATIHQVFPLAAFPRLCEGAASDEGGVQVDCRVYRDAQGLIRLEGRLETTVLLTCQRCLEPVAKAIGADVQLCLLRDEDEAAALPEDADYLVLDEEGRVALADALEDELILSLPLVASHDDCEPYAAANDDDAEAATPARENPFQVLASLKGRTEK